MKKLSSINCVLCTLLLLCFSLSLNAKPAYRGGVNVTQPDGTTLTIYQHGDEHFHYLTLADGTWVQKQANGFYTHIEALSLAEVRTKHKEARMRRLPAQTQQAYPLNIAPRGLVILVNFSDVKMDAANTREAFDRMLNSADYTENGATGSARQYFIDQSRGQYQPHFDVVGPVDLPETMAYYGANNAYGEDQNVHKLVLKACGLADELGVDFSQYDNNNDGEVDFVYFIYAGYGEADSYIEETIWPHAFWLYEGYGQKFTLDGKRIDMYACGAELNFGTKKRDGIGTFCHEFGHVLGLPDLYATNGAKHKNLGMWDIMDYGSYNNDGNTPPCYSAYERFFLGWLKPTLLNEPTTVTLQDIQSGNGAALISPTGTHNLIGNDPDTTEFYLLENRQQTGWDAYIKGHGMILTRIDYNYFNWFDNSPNNDASNLRVDLLEADGKDAYSFYNGKLGDAFPHGASEVTVAEHYEITNIKEENGFITFDFMGGGNEIKIPVNAALDNLISGEETIMAIYNILGQNQGTTDINSITTSGIYIIKTNKGTKKISIR